MFAAVQWSSLGAWIVRCRSTLLILQMAEDGRGFKLPGRCPWDNVGKPFRLGSQRASHCRRQLGLPISIADSASHAGSTRHLGQTRATHWFPCSQDRSGGLNQCDARGASVRRTGANLPICPQSNSPVRRTRGLIKVKGQIICHAPVSFSRQGASGFDRCEAGHLQ